MTGKQVYLRLLGYVVPYRRVFALAILAMIVLAATEPAIPALLKPTLDSGFVNKDMDTVTFMSIMTVVLFFVRGASGFVSASAMAWVANKIVMDLRRAMFDKLVELPASFYDRQPSGTLISKITYDAAQTADAATVAITVLVKDTLIVAGLLGWLFYLDWRLTMITLAAAPIVMLMVKYFTRRLRSSSQNLQRSMGDVTHVLEETIQGQRVVRSFGGQDYEKNRFKVAANWARRYQTKFAVSAAANAPAAQLVIAFAFAAILYLAGKQSIEGETTVGSFVSFFAAMALLFSPIKRLTSINSHLQRGIAAAASAFGLMDELSEPDTGTRTMERARGALELRNVTFSYDRGERRALEDVSLRAEPGDMLALVGPSGGGKTTIASLIPRFYELESGAIYLDGVDTRELTLDALRRQIAVVTQEIVLFNDTVGANIAYGPLAGASRAAITEAAAAANAWEFIEALPQGLETQVGERGVRLSGGQRQRLAIARAFLKDAPVLILDEATSSVDNESERRIQEALLRLREGRTTFVIAHRLSSIERADRVAVVSEGKVQDIGTHASLLESSTVYSSLYRFQFDRPAESGPVADAHER